MIKNHHPRNKHNNGYNFDKLVEAVPELETYLVKNVKGETTIPFAEPKSVKLLNKALLLADYGLTFWDIPEGQLCPPIPGRVDYIHYLADLLGTEVTKKVLDIGTGASLIYPILGTLEYGWSFVGADISKESLQNAHNIIAKNEPLLAKISLRLQPDNLLFFQNIIQENEYFDAVLCNPPFYKSAEEASSQSDRKLQNLKLERGVNNFGGKANELWFPGGELRFISLMIKESVHFKSQVGWFTSLVSDKDNLYAFQKLLKKIGVSKVEIIKMQQGNKNSRFLAWKF